MSWAFFNNRVEFTADVYKRTTDDLLLNAQLPPTVGFGTAFKNIGKIENKGLELTLNARVITAKDFSWESSINITFNKNKVLALTEGQLSLDNTVVTDVNYNDNLYTSEIGKPSGMMVGYIWEGNYQYADFDNPAPGVYGAEAGSARQREAPQHHPAGRCEVPRHERRRQREFRRQNDHRPRPALVTPAVS